MFGDPISLRVSDELARGQVPERAVGTVVIVVEAPGFDLLPGVVQGEELLHVQALVAQAAVEGLDVRGPGWLAS